jgi:hypothetical protein
MTDSNVVTLPWPEAVERMVRLIGGGPSAMALPEHRRVAAIVQTQAALAALRAEDLRAARVFLADALALTIAAQDGQ